MYFIFIFSLKNQDISASVNGHFFFFFEKLASGMKSFVNNFVKR